MDRMNKEQERLKDHYTNKKNWLKWGPYLSERQWGTVREDYSKDGEAWEYFPFEDAHFRTYRWGEDGIGGISDNQGNINFALVLWNHKDDILKERLFGLTGPQGNHGEDVKELYFYKDNTPTHSFMKYEYKYPTSKFPYQELIDKNKKASKEDKEVEITDTNAFKNSAYFNIEIEYAKRDESDILIKITITNKSNKQEKLSVLPTLWIKNFWSFKGESSKPLLKKTTDQNRVEVYHDTSGNHFLYYEKAVDILFTENETNTNKLNGQSNNHPFKKDLISNEVTAGKLEKATSRSFGTRCSPLYENSLDSGETVEIRLRFSSQEIENPFNDEFNGVLENREQEASSFYKSLLPQQDPNFEILKDALSGTLWNKQYYSYNIEEWLYSDLGKKAPKNRLTGRNSEWPELKNFDILSMPDKWEYPWYAAWDTAFHCVSLALVDIEFAKKQLLVLMQDGYMDPSGQIPAYEWSFEDVNPPVQAWSAMEIYSREMAVSGIRDISFLKKAFNRLAINFTWWVNREDLSGHNIFQGGFLGLDNIGVFDRSSGIPAGGQLQQVDATSWMAQFALHMLEISLELAMDDSSYEDMAIKYLSHFVYIAEAFNSDEGTGTTLWDSKDEFYYDNLILEDRTIPIKVRSIAGLLPLTAINEIKKEYFDTLPNFKAKLAWFQNRQQSKSSFDIISKDDSGNYLITLVPRDRLHKLLVALFNEEEFLGKFGIRSLSRKHKKPYTLVVEKEEYSINYEPAETTSGMFGGNSNWRGPVWFPLNYLLLLAIGQYKNCFGDEVEFEYPTGSGDNKSLAFIENDITSRLTNIFLKDENGNRPAHSHQKDIFQNEDFKNNILLYEYFNPETGRGCGASHQTGWTALIANLIVSKTGKDTKK